MTGNFVDSNFLLATVARVLEFFKTAPFRVSRKFCSKFNANSTKDCHSATKYFKALGDVFRGKRKRTRVEINLYQTKFHFDSLRGGRRAAVKRR